MTPALTLPRPAAARTTAQTPPAPHAALTAPQDATVRPSLDVRERAPERARGPERARVVVLAGADLFAWREAVWGSSLTSKEKLVALAFADHVRDGDTGSVWVARDRLQARTGLGKTAAWSAVVSLCELGWLVEVSPARQHYSARYALHVPDDVAEDPSGSPREPLSGSPREPLASQTFATRTADALRGSPRELRGSRGELRGSPREPDLPTTPTTTPVNDPAPTLDAPPAPDTDRLVLEIRTAAPALTSAMSASTLTKHATDLHDAGWTPTALAASLATQDFSRARGPGLLLHRLAELEKAGPPHAVTDSRPTWCTRCDERTRMREDADGNPSRCPDCHPTSERTPR